MPDQPSPYKMPWEVPNEKPKTTEPIEYLRNRLSQGVTKKTIEADLLQAGWTKSQTDQIFQQIQSMEKSVQQENDLPLPEKLLSGKILQWVFLSFFAGQFLFNLFNVISSGNSFEFQSISQALFFPSFTFWLPLFGSPLIWLIFFYAFYSYSRVLIKLGYILQWVVFVILLISTLSLFGTVPYLNTISVNSRNLDNSMLALIILPLLVATGILLYFIKLNLAQVNKYEDIVKSNEAKTVSAVKTIKGPRIDMIVLLFFLSFLGLFFGYFFGGGIMLAVMLRIENTSELLTWLRVISFIILTLLFVFFPLIIYLSKWIKYIVRIQVVIIVLCVVIVASLTFGFRDGPVPPENIKRISTVVASDNILYVKTEGVYDNCDLFWGCDTVVYPAIWVYQISDGSFLDIKYGDREAADLSEQIKEIEEKLSKENRELFYEKRNRGEINRPDRNKNIKIKSNSIVIEYDFNRSKDKKLKQLNGEVNPAHTPQWTWDDYKYILVPEKSVNQTTMYRINMITDRVTEVDSVSKILYPSHTQRYYKDELIITARETKSTDYSITDVLVFNTSKNKFTTKVEILEDYGGIFYQYPDFIFLFNYKKSQGSDGVLMINKKTGDMFKFTGKSDNEDL